MDIKKVELALDEVLKDYRDPKQIKGLGDRLNQFTKTFPERAMTAEIAIRQPKIRFRRRSRVWRNRHFP